MKFGLFHSVQLPNPDEQARYYREALDQVLHAERLGYSSVWFTEHHFTRHGIVSATTCRCWPTWPASPTPSGWELP